MVWNRRRAAALAACAWSRVTDGIPHDGADPRLRQERRLEALQDRMDWVGEREPEPVRGTRIAAGEQQRDRLYVPIDDQRSAVAAVAEGVCADALDLHLPVEPQVADVVFTTTLSRSNAVTRPSVTPVVRPILYTVAPTSRNPGPTPARCRPAPATIPRSQLASHGTPPCIAPSAQSTRLALVLLSRTQYRSRAARAAARLPLSYA